jgi:hypothetical protein
MVEALPLPFALAVPLLCEAAVSGLISLAQLTLSQGS